MKTKKLQPSIVLLDDIRIPADSKPTDYDAKQLQEAAELIVMCEGVITPIILIEEKQDDYSLLEGWFEFWAAKKAEEIDPLSVESINVYIINDDNYDLYEKQIELFRKKRGKKQVEEAEATKENIEEVDSTQEKQEKHVIDVTMVANIAADIPYKVAKMIIDKEINYQQTLEKLTSFKGVGRVLANLIMEYEFDYKKIENSNTIRLGKKRLAYLKNAIENQPDFIVINNN